MGINTTYNEFEQFNNKNIIKGEFHKYTVKINGCK